MKRIWWTIGMAIVGFCFGWYAQGYPLNFGEMAIATMWGGSIGYGFGSIIDEHHPRRRLIIYWAATLAVVGPFFGALLPFASFGVREVLAGMIGALAGVLVGIIHLKSVRRKSQAPDAVAGG